MAAERKLYGLYNDDHLMVDGARTLVGKGIRINDAYSPFPVHGIDKVIGVKWTRIAICAFLYGLTGTMLAVVGTYYFMIVDWPMDIGGKPNFFFYQNLPAFVPIIFEFAVLCAAHGMALTYFARNGTWPGAKAVNPHPRTTDDHFALEIVPSQNGQVDHASLVEMLKGTGTVEVFEK
jgi:hypothetical protein